MRRSYESILTAAFVVALSAGAASAADLAARPYAKAPLAQPVYSWTGCYVGAVAGAGRTLWDRNGLYDTNPVNDSFTAGTATIGGTLGCNYQFAPTWLVGIEGDYNWIDSRNHLTSAAGADPTGGSFDDDSLADLRSRWFGTVRGRLGYLPDPRVLLFVTGGAAFGDTTYSVNDFSPDGLGSGKRNSTGYAVGGGAEYLLAANWTVKGEYLHVDLGNKTFSPVPGVNAPDFVTRIKTTHDLVRIGVNYKFF